MTTRLYPLIKFLFFVSLIATTITSCKKDDPDPPDYNGSWVSLGSITNDETSFEMKEIITFTGEEFSEVMQIKNPGNNKWIDYLGLKGTVSVTGKTMNITIKEAGLSAIDPFTSLPTGQITYYDSSQKEFNLFIDGYGLTTIYQSDYQISDTGKEITLKTDYNDDSDFNDEGEVTTYTRQ